MCDELAMKISLKSHHRAWRGESETNLCLFINRCEHWVREGRESEGAYYKFYTTKSKSESNEGRKKRKESVARKKTFPSFFLAFHENCALASQHKKETYISTGNWKLFLTLDRHRPHPFHKFLFLFSTAPNTDRKEITVKIFPFKDQKSTRLTTIVSLSQTSQFFLFTSSFSTP